MRKICYSPLRRHGFRTRTFCLELLWTVWHWGSLLNPFCRFLLSLNMWSVFHSHTSISSSLRVCQHWRDRPFFTTYILITSFTASLFSEEVRNCIHVVSTSVWITDRLFVTDGTSAAILSLCKNLQTTTTSSVDISAPFLSHTTYNWSTVIYDFNNSENFTFISCYFSTGKKHNQ